MKSVLVCVAVFVSLVVGNSVARAGVVVSTYADQPTWNGTPTIQTNAAPQATIGVTGTNQQVGAGNTLAQTFRTGPSGFKLDQIHIYSGGQGGGNIRLNIYPDPVGGEDTDGFVNTSFSTDLLGGGAGLTFNLSGSGGLRYVVLDLTGSDEITLDPNQQYAIEFDVLDGAQFSWQRSGAGTYPDGNLYAGATELNFNGTPPANNRGQRNQVGGTPQRDAGMALFAPAAIPEPTSFALLSVVGLLFAFANAGLRRVR